MDSPGKFQRANGWNCIITVDNISLTYFSMANILRNYLIRKAKGGVFFKLLFFMTYIYLTNLFLHIITC